jgi:hypothetical protein
VLVPHGLVYIVVLAQQIRRNKMADDFKALVALTKETNAKLELLHRQGEEDDTPRERLLDALPEIVSQERISSKEKAQREKHHKEDQKNREKTTVQAVKETAKETSKPIVKAVTEDTKFSAVLNQNLLTSIDSGNMKLIGSSVLGSEKIALSLNSFTNAFEPYLESGLKESKEGMKFFKSLNFLKPTGAQAAEDEKKKIKRQELLTKGLTGLKDGLKGLLAGGFGKLKSGLSGLAKFALGGLALAALAFLNDPKFVKMASTFIDDIIPKIAFVLDEYIIPFGKMVGGRLLNLFKNIHKAFTDPNYGIFDLLNDNILELGLLTGLIAPSLFTVPLKLAFSGLFGALKILPSTLTKLFAGGAILGGIFNLGKDFKKEFDKTGSISKSFAAALASEGEGGVAQALGNLGKFGLIGFGAGMLFTPLGAMIGGLAGSFIDFALGYFGQGAVEKSISSAKDGILRMRKNLIDGIRDFFTSTILGFKSFFLLGRLSKEDRAEKNKADRNLKIRSLSLEMNKAKTMMDINRGYTSVEGVKRFSDASDRFFAAQKSLQEIKGLSPAALEQKRLTDISADRSARAANKFVTDPTGRGPEAVISAPYFDHRGRSSTTVINSGSIRNNNAVLSAIDAAYGVN